LIRRGNTTATAGTIFNSTNSKGLDLKNAYLMAEEYICQEAKAGAEIYTASLNLLEIDMQNSCIISPNATMLIWPSIEKLQKPDEQ
jgi:hypothetical protein